MEEPIKIDIYEVEGALADDYTFPFIKVTLPDGTEYTCLDMGAGEYLCMYIFGSLTGLIQILFYL